MNIKELAEEIEQVVCYNWDDDLDHYGDHCGA